MCPNKPQYHAQLRAAHHFYLSRAPNMGFRTWTMMSLQSRHAAQQPSSSVAHPSSTIPHHTGRGASLGKGWRGYCKTIPDANRGSCPHPTLWSSPASRFTESASGTGYKDCYPGLNSQGQTGISHSEFSQACSCCPRSMEVTNPKRIDPSPSDCLDMFFYCLLFFFFLFLYRKFDKRRNGMTVEPWPKISEDG